MPSVLLGNLSVCVRALNSWHCRVQTFIIIIIVITIKALPNFKFNFVSLGYRKYHFGYPSQNSDNTFIQITTLKCIFRQLEKRFGTPKFTFGYFAVSACLCIVPALRRYKVLGSKQPIIFNFIARRSAVREGRY